MLDLNCQMLEILVQRNIKWFGHTGAEEDNKMKTPLWSAFDHERLKLWS